MHAVHVVTRPALAGICAVLCALIAGCGAPGTIGGSQTLPPLSAAQPTAMPLAPIQFPRDEAPHRLLTEWWYYTGHLHGVDTIGHAHDYGFEFTVFQTLRGQFPPYYAAHFAVSDLTRGTFHYDQRAAFSALSTIPPAGSTTGVDLAVADWHLRGLTGHDQLDAAMPDYSISLRLTALKPPVLHGGTGIISYGQAGFSYYYSRPIMVVAGTVHDHSLPVPVSGVAWMDHQWGNFVSLAGAGWDWFSIQLDDDTEYMLYVIRDAHKAPLATVGTYVAPDGAESQLVASGITIHVRSTWTSPVTGGVYPSGWAIAVAPRLATFTLTPDLLNQELVTTESTGVAYWEGAVRIYGQVGGRPVSGQGYVELTGYARVPPTAAQMPLP